jgi:hypothetical protein
MSKTKTVLIVLVAVLVGLAAAPAQAQLTTPKQQFGFNVGDDYQLINYTQLLAYWKKLDQQSDRMTLVNIGTSSEGRQMVMAIITSPKNKSKLDLYKSISRRLALAQGLTETDARKLAQQGKAVVWVDGGLHASEIVGSQQLMELVWQMVSRNDAETLRILDDVILLAVPVNPDGLELVANWYLREKDPSKRTMGGLPRLYQKFVGHDNNRDYYMVAQPETEIISRQLYIEWHPQMLYNHHQTGPAGTVLFCPPFRDPFNYYFDPLVPIGTDAMGLAMHERFAAEGKPGAIMRSGASYSTWWNGGLRSTGYFHNIIGILTEIIGNPTPMDIPFIPDRVLPKGDYPYPIMPQKWHFRQSIDYSVTADKAMLDIASRKREEFLFNRYIMGRNAIAKGNTDTWTFQPLEISAVQAQVEKERAQAQQQAGGAGQAGAPAMGGMGGQRAGGSANMKYYEALRDPARRDPRGFIIPSDQPDFLTAIKFVNTLMKSGVQVHRATKPFAVAGKTYPQGSYIVKAAQAFRAHVMSMFEPQDHPNDFAYPGGPPRPPYDSAGWTVAFQMGVQFDRILDAFNGPFEEVKGPVKPLAGTLGSDPAKAAGFLLDHRVLDSFVALNRLLKNKEDVYWMKNAFLANGKSYPAGTIYIPAKPSVLPVLQKAAKEKGLTFEPCDLKPAGEAFKLKPVRLGVWDQYGGSMDSGWAQWILEQFEFAYDVVYPPALDAGDLNTKYDVLLFVEGGIPGFGGGGRGGFGGAAPANIPDEYKALVGRVSVDKTLPLLRKFVENGGTILTIGGSTSLAYHFGLPVANHMIEKAADGREVPVGQQKFYAPGSVLQVKVDTTQPLAYGLAERTDVFYDNSPVFDLLPDASRLKVVPIAWFENMNPLRSGWVWGDQYLYRGIQVIEAPLGKGKIFLFAPEITFRGQPHGTFKFLFNGIYYGPAESAALN